MVAGALGDQKIRTPRDPDPCGAHASLFCSGSQMLVEHAFGRISRWLIWVLLGAALAEIGAAALCWFLLIPSHAGRFLWNPDLEEARNNWFAFSGSTDEEIGGATIFSEASGAPRDPTGAKQNPDFPNPARACGSAYGESLVLGYEVPASLGWVEQLSRLLGCRIANYAVNSNSSDQAYLRFIREKDETPFVLLGIDPSTIIDNVNQYSGFLWGQLGPYALKGRFVIDPADQLRWLERPRLDADGFIALHRMPAQILPHDYFLPDTVDGPVTFRFPYSLTLFRLALLPRMRHVLARRAEWRGFYAVDHPSGALPLLVAICKAFVQHADSWGSRVLIIALPVAQSFREQAGSGKFEYAPLVTTLQAQGLPVFDPGPEMLDLLGGRSYCELFTQPRLCRGHYSVFGNTMIAKLMAAELRRRSFVGG
jgi:hypothetical protein